jgi:hypothetical protein
MISYKNEWGEWVTIYVEGLPDKIKLTFAKKNRTDMFCIPDENREEFIKLLTKEKTNEEIRHSS